MFFLVLLFVNLFHNLIHQVVQADAIPDGWMGLDNGPEATKEIQAALKQVRPSLL